jgi:hypothetical protein
MIKLVHGRWCVSDGHRWKAIPKVMTTTDAVAAKTTANLRTSWDKIMDSPQGGHVIVNQKRADARRDARWRNAVIKARFT